MQQSYDVVIIGGGVVGSAIARELSRYKLRIAVLEKESDVCTQTSGRNTGMLHAGFLYKTGSLKAICAVEGNQEFDQVARELDVPFKRTGKLIVGFTDEHRQRLEQFMARGEANGVKGLVLIHINRRVVILEMFHQVDGRKTVVFQVLGRIVRFHFRPLIFFFRSCRFHLKAGLFFPGNFFRH